MDNARISEIFEKMADILEIQGENTFRVRAYRKAAQTIGNISEDARTLIEKGKLTTLPGIGEDLAGKIAEFCETGKIDSFERLRKTVKPVLFEMLNIPGVGPKTAKLLYEKLKIKNLAQLESKARAHKIQGLPGMQNKAEESILRGLEFLKKDRGRMRLDAACAAADEIISGLRKHPEVIEISPAGSLRRMRETVRDIDILATSEKGDKVMDAFTALPNISAVLARGPTKSSVLTKGNIQIDLRVVPPESYGAALMYFTGSKAHNITLREIAVRKGLKINEYGVFRVRGNRRAAGKTESDIYELLKMPYIPPELRENTGEIDMAAKGALPRVVTLNDIKGDFHVHTKESDGTLSLGEIAQAGRKKKYQYVVISDHSKSLKIANGLSEQRLLKNIERVRDFNRRSRDIKFLISSEVDIRSDGRLDYGDDILKKLDFVIAAIHTGFHQPKEKLTERIVRAMRNKYVNLLAHPSGRLIGERESYELDYEKIFDTARKTGTAIEINAYPQRLDLTDVNCKRARELGVKLAVSTDTHAAGQLDNMRYGVSTARRGWVRREDLLNCTSAKGVREFVEKKRNAAKIA